MKEQTTITKVEFAFPLEIMKQTEESGEFHIVGYAATTDFDLQGDVITEDALKNSSLDLLKNSTVLLNHDIESAIGRVTKAEFDKNGLLIDVLISQTEPNIIQKIKEGVLNKFSIRGQVLEREKKYMAEFDRVVNVIKKMVLVEVSLVSVPANPEARAIGWYVKKALDEIDSLKKGGDPMSKEETVIDELNPEDPKPGETPPAADPKPEDPKPEPEPEKTPDPSDQPPEKVAGKETKKKDKETMKGNEVVAKIEPVWMMLDKLIALGGEIAPAAIEIKSTLKQAVGEMWTPPVVIPPASPETVSKDEMAEMISTEVKKQIEPLLKQIPAIRKGVIQPEPETEEVKKTFEGLPPQKKLKVALALHQA
ncbi:MAG: hypothetical protein KCHDKBKB_01597 [Elusimicrobia bacterium]|nr:hypothetical protein [Elusimicrobiota bacterium]